MKNNLANRSPETETIKQQIAVYPGSFDPITLGHMDIILRSSKMFDRLIVGVVAKLSPNGLFSEEERCRFIELGLKEYPELAGKVQVKAFSNLLVDFLVECDANFIVRGLRAVSDFDYEYAMFQMNQETAPIEIEVDTVFLLASKQYSFLSSTIVKEFARFGRNMKQYISPPVNEALIQKFRDNAKT